MLRFSAIGATLCAGFVVVQPPPTAGIAAANTLPSRASSAIVAQASLQDEGDDAIAAVAAVLAQKSSSASSKVDATVDEEEATAPPRKLAVDVDLALSLSAADQDEVEAEANEVFDKIDENSDGYITRDELAQHLKGTGYSMRAIDGMFGSLDANDDGKISRAEMQAAYKRYESSSLRLALGLAAGVAPKQETSGRSSSGAATAAAVSSSAEAPIDAANVNGRIQTADELFSLIDTNGDGEISLAELRAHLGDRGYASTTVDTIFSLLDVAPKDGIISRDELRRCFETYEYSALRLALKID